MVRSVCVWPLLIALLCACACAEDLVSALIDDGPLPEALRGLTPENVEERVTPFIRQGRGVEDEKRKAMYYVFLTEVVSGQISESRGQPFVIDLLNEGLTCDLSTIERARMLAHKGLAVRYLHGRARGEELRDPRREVMALSLESYRLLRDYVKEVEERFKRDHPDFDPEKPPEWDWDPSENRNIDWAGPAPPGKPTEELNEWMALKDEYERMEYARRRYKGFHGVFVDLYARAPYDLEELRSLVTEVLGDEALARELVERTKREIGHRLRLLYRGDEEEDLLKSIEDIDTMPPDDAAPTPSTPSPPEASVPDASSPQPAASPPEKEVNLYPLWIAAGLGVAAVGSLFLRRLVGRG